MELLVLLGLWLVAWNWLVKKLSGRSLLDYYRHFRDRRRCD